MVLAPCPTDGHGLLPLPPAFPPPGRAAVALAAQLDYERAKGRLEELNAVAEHLPALVLVDRRWLLIDRLREASNNWRAARAELNAETALAHHLPGPARPAAGAAGETKETHLVEPPAQWDLT